MPSHDIPRPSPVSSASQQGLKARRVRRGYDSFESYDELKRWVLSHFRIDDEWKLAIAEGIARIVASRDGVWVCKGLECYKLIKRIERLSLDAYRLLRALLDGPKTIHQLLSELMIPYDRLYQYIYYYKKVGLLRETQLGFSVNQSHPQFNSLKNVLDRSLFYEARQTWASLGESGRVWVQEISSKQVSEESKELTDSEIEERIVEEARKRISLDSYEETVLRGIARLCIEAAREGSKPWVYFNTWEELADMLAKATSSNNISARDLPNIIMKLVNARILWVPPRPDKYLKRKGVRIHRALARKLGLER